MAEGIPQDRRYGRLFGLERALVRVRWFGLLFGIFQIAQGRLPTCRTFDLAPTGCDPSYVRPIGYAALVALAVFNVLIMYLLRKSPSMRSLGKMGAASLTMDHLVLITMVWLFSSSLQSTSWVILYIAPLEGALRYGMRGAMGSLAVLGASEVGRDFFRQIMWDYEFFLVPDTTFRVGIMAIIGLVSGVMARNLERERDEVSKHADTMAALAERETASRKEILAFQKAILAGVSTTHDFDEAMQKMMDTIGETLSFESLAMGLIEENSAGLKHVRVVAGHRYPKEALGKTIGMDEGVCGPVALTGEPILVNDVTRHVGYLEFTPWTRSEMAVPLKVGDRIIGVLNVESPEKDAFDEARLQQLVRLAAQVSVVVENARILAREQAAVERLTELDTMKTDFIAITSHELRTPLTVLNGFIQTLRRPDMAHDPEQLSTYLEVMDRQTTRLNALVEDLLFVARMESGELDIQSSSVDVSQSLKQLIEESFAETASRIVLKAEQDSRIVTDKDRLMRAIGALMDNGLKFSPENSMIIVSARPIEGGLVIEVHDDGVGIPPDELDRIFDRFHQVGGAMKRHQSGFGLGLYTARKIIEALGGEISARSTQGRGSTFVVSLPTSPAPGGQGASRRSDPQRDAKHA